MNTTDRDDALLRAAAALPETIEPQRDLWPGIAAQLAQSHAAKTSRTWVYSLAASFALVAITAGITWRVATMNDAKPSAPVAVAEQASAPAAPDQTKGELRFMRAQLMTVLEDNLARLPPASRRVVIDNLLDIRASLAAIEQALVADPTNPSLQQLLYTTYEHELSVLAGINRVALTLPTEVEI